MVYNYIILLVKILADNLFVCPVRDIFLLFKLTMFEQAIGLQMQIRVFSNQWCASLCYGMLVAYIAV